MMERERQQHNDRTLVNGQARGLSRPGLPHRLRLRDGAPRLTAAIPMENPCCSCKLTHRVQADAPSPVDADWAVVDAPHDFIAEYGNFTVTRRLLPRVFSNGTAFALLPRCLRGCEGTDFSLCPRCRAPPFALCVPAVSRG